MPAALYCAGVVEWNSLRVGTMSPAPPATAGNRPIGAVNHTGLLAAAKVEEASPASGARDRGSTSRLAPGAWRRVAAARAARASLEAAERAGIAGGVWV